MEPLLWNWVSLMGKDTRQSHCHCFTNIFRAMKPRRQHVCHTKNQRNKFEACEIWTKFGLKADAKRFSNNCRAKFEVKVRRSTPARNSDSKNCKFSLPDTACFTCTRFGRIRSNHRNFGTWSVQFNFITFNGHLQRVCCPFWLRIIAALAQRTSAQKTLHHRKKMTQDHTKPPN